MPMYEYQCSECNYRFETLQKISDAPLKNCPECSKDTLNKLVSAASFRLKGGGWYETDFKKDKQKNIVSSGTTDVNTSSDTDSTTTSSAKDSKPAETKSTTETKS